MDAGGGSVLRQPDVVGRGTPMEPGGAQLHGVGRPMHQVVTQALWKADQQRLKGKGKTRRGKGKGGFLKGKDPEPQPAAHVPAMPARLRSVEGRARQPDHTAVD
eukprot:10040871-Alexandrium_andersonii.AAC.1